MRKLLAVFGLCLCASQALADPSYDAARYYHNYWHGGYHSSYNYSYSYRNRTAETIAIVNGVLLGTALLSQPRQSYGRYDEGYRAGLEYQRGYSRGLEDGKNEWREFWGLNR